MTLSTTARRVGGIVAAVGSFYLIDKHFCYSTVQRNLYTLATAAIITLDVKLNFQPEKADKIDSLHDRVSRRILDCCKNNGGLYIKFGQVRVILLNLSKIANCYSASIASSIYSKSKATIR